VTPRSAIDDVQLSRLRELFDEALSAPPGERESFVRDTLATDPTLHDELSSLLDAHDASDGYFEKLSLDLVIPALIAIESDAEDIGDVDRISHYEMMERIGRGGMGIVYKARDTRLGRIVALKFLPRHHEANPAARARLLAEARAASALDHPNIGVVYEIAETTDGRQFIAMAWYDGETLKERASRARLPVSEAVALASQLGSALEAAHAAGIIHRDVKPANVIITRSGTVRLVDFGIAKLVRADDQERSAAAGTVAYMSPEQTRDSILDTRTDIWSLGVLLYELLAGQRPFRGDTDDDVVSAIRSEEPARLSGLRPDVPEGVLSVIDKCMRKNPDERYQSAAELCEVLNRCDSSHVASGDQSGETSSAGRTHLSRRRTELAVASILFLAVAALGGWGYKKFRNAGTSSENSMGSHMTSIAVLPFGNKGSDTAAYLAEGLSDDLRAELSRVGSVSVASYRSSANYSGSPGNIPEVAPRMGTQFLITGEVVREAGDTRVHVRLIDGRNLATLWSKDYPATPSATGEIVPSAVRAILSKTDAEIPDGDVGLLERQFSKNPRAYDLYLRGRYEELRAAPKTALGKPDIEGMRRAQANYAQARALDPAFAAARARLANTHVFSATAYDTTRARLDQARLEAETALRLDPRLVDSHEALATYWTRVGSPEKGIGELEGALRSFPGNIDLLLSLGLRYVEAGRWDDGVALFERAMQLDPHNPRAAWLAATSYGRMRRYDKGMKAFARLIAISPDDHEMKVTRGQSYLRWKGTADTLIAALRSIPPESDISGMSTYGWYTAYMVKRDYRAALAKLDSTRASLSRDGLVYQPRSLMRAELYHALGDRRNAQLNYEAALRMLSDSSAAHPRDASIHGAMGLALAGLGRKRQAIAESERAMDLVRVATNSRNSTAFMGLAIEVLGRVGERDRAFEMIELMLSMPSGREASVPFLRVWPGFDSLRSDPRFNELLERFTVK